MRNTQEQIIRALPRTALSSPHLREVRRKLSRKNKNSQLDAVVVLGATMDYTPKRRRWSFGTIVHNGVGRIDAGNSRTIAAKQLTDEGYNGPFLVTGGNQQAPDGQSVSQAGELAHVMVRKRKLVPSHVIAIGQETSTNTLGNVSDVVKFLSHHPDALNHKKIGILANEWHMLRALLLFNANPFFKEKGIEIVPLVANKILTRRSRRYKKWNKAVAQLPEMQAKIVLEANGIQDFLAGRYKPRH